VSADLRILITGPEISALDGLPTLAKALYYALRVRMDGVTRIVGRARGVSWAALAGDLYVEPHRGTVERSPTPRRLRNANGWLMNAGLVQMRSDKNLWSLVFFLPVAPELSRVRNQPVSNRSGQTVMAGEGIFHRGKGELSPGNGQKRAGLTGQTSKESSKHRAAAGQRASLTKPTATSAALRAGPNENTAYRVPHRGTLMAPPRTTDLLWRQYEVIAAERRLSREVLQLAFDAVAGVMASKPVKNPVALFVTILDQIGAGRFYDQKANDHARRERGGGMPISEGEIETARHPASITAAALAADGDGRGRRSTKVTPRVARRRGTSPG
jgi:hypothetical protein